ncbi:MAG: ribbon-helix-helix protein, CopG family [Candidatus Heimdallarchaeota archaeon]|jgi:Arc/MetJ-type ribon-helix-helix transcriptional regulator|nr:MAG: ribbon-helix-helix protein, CopG family [Candidatus Heimdallarchaeota archaeon]
MKLISFKAPNTYLEGLDELVRAGVYSSRSEAIRMAIRDLLKRELNWKAGSSPASLAEVE